MFLPAIGSSGTHSDLMVPPFKSTPGLASATVLPALRDVIYVEDKAHLPAAARPNKKRTPLPNSRHLRPVPMYTEYASSKYSSIGRKRELDSGDGEDEANPGVRAPKRYCQGLQPLPTNVDWSLNENKDTKPPKSFVQLSRAAILNAEEQVLTLDGIVASIKADYAYYRLLQDSKPWKASIYNGLRSSKAFEKVGRSTMINAQRWQVKAEYRTENLPVRKSTYKGRSQVPFAVQFAVPYTWSNPPP